MDTLFKNDADSVVLVDGKNFLFRNFYPHSKLKTSSGENTGALFGCLNGLLTVAHKLEDSPICFVWEGVGETWRHRLLKPVQREEKIKSPVKSGWFDRQIKQSMGMLQGDTDRRFPEFASSESPKIVGYKATRNLNATVDQKEQRKIALKQVPELIQALRWLGVPQFQVDGLECDDLIGIMAKYILDKKLFKEVIILSTDRDFFQLMARPGVRVLRHVKGEMVFVKEEDIIAEFGIGVKDWVKYRAIVGDDSDNIPNIFAGIGPVKGLKLLKMGIDASKKDYRDIDENVWMAMMEYSTGELDINEVWKRLRRNYLASHIVTDDQFYLFDYNVRRDTGGLVATLKRESFFRSKKGRTEDSFRKFSEWIVAKEMDSLRSRREEFFQLL